MSKHYILTTFYALSTYSIDHIAGVAVVLLCLKILPLSCYHTFAVCCAEPLAWPLTSFRIFYDFLFILLVTREKLTFGKLTFADDRKLKNY